MYQKEYSTRNAAERATGLKYKQRAEGLERILNDINDQLQACETLLNVNSSPLATIVITNIRNILNQRDGQNYNNMLENSAAAETPEQGRLTIGEEETRDQRQQQNKSPNTSYRESGSYTENKTLFTPMVNSPDITNIPPRSAVSAVRPNPATTSTSTAITTTPNSRRGIANKPVKKSAAVGNPAITKKKRRRPFLTMAKKKQQYRKKPLNECKICNIQFGTDELACQEHQKQHDASYNHKSYQCSLCPFRSYNKQNVIIHITGFHHSSELFRCPFENCDFIATEDGLLKSHVRKEHLTFENGSIKNRLFPCPMCEYKSNNKSNLSRHIQRMHVKKQLQLLGQSQDQNQELEEGQGLEQDLEEEEQSQYQDDEDDQDQEDQDMQIPSFPLSSSSSSPSSPLIIPQNFCQAVVEGGSDDEDEERVDIIDDCVQ